MIQPLGTVSRIAQGLLVLRVTEPPPTGQTVVNDQLEVIGTVVSVFGPVAEPFVAISPADDTVDLPSLLGDKLYVRS